MTGKVIQCYAPETVYDMVKEMAQADVRTISNTVRLCIEREWARRGRDAEAKGLKPNTAYDVHVTAVEQSTIDLINGDNEDETDH